MELQRSCRARQSVHYLSRVGQYLPLGRGMVLVVEREVVSTFNDREGRYGNGAKILQNSLAGCVPSPVFLGLPALDEPLSSLDELLLALDELPPAVDWLPPAVDWLLPAVDWLLPAVD